MQSTEEFGSKLRELRNARGLTQRQLADLMIVSNGAIGNWETGNRLLRGSVHMLERELPSAEIIGFSNAAEAFRFSDSNPVSIAEPQLKAPVKNGMAVG